MMVAYRGSNYFFIPRYANAHPHIRKPPDAAVMIDHLTTAATYGECDASEYATAAIKTISEKAIIPLITLMS